MEPVVRAIDVGFGNTKFVVDRCWKEVGTPEQEAGKAKGFRAKERAIAKAIRCASFPSLAYPSTRDMSKLSPSERRDTIAVPIDGLFYEVGPDVTLAADTFRATQLHDGYTETPEYAALLRGALRRMDVPEIDLLVVGLPVASFLAKKAALEKATTGLFEVERGHSVLVRKALVLAQPQGALAYFGTLHEKLKTIETEQSLVIDPGARTFDWLVARGMRYVQKKSDSVNRGMFDILYKIAADIGRDIGTPYRDLDAIDLALRTGKNPIIFQQPYDIAPLMPIARSIAQQAISSMMGSIGDVYAFQNIVLVGGGAYLFRQAVKEAFPKHTIHELTEPMYANVRGFQIIGESFFGERTRKPTARAPSTPRSEGGAQ